MKPEVFRFVFAFALVSQAAFSTAYAGNGAAEGNGNPDPAIAYTPEKLEGIRQSINLDYMKLTPKQVRERDKKLGVIYDYYREATLGKVAEQIEAAFATNVYHYQNTENKMYTPNLGDKKAVMDSAVRFYTGYDLKESPFASASPSVLQYRDSVYFNDTKVRLQKIEGDDEFKSEIYSSYPFAIATSKSHTSTSGYILGMFHHYTDHYALYSSTPNNLFDFPVMDDYLTAMKESELKALDATVVFSSGDVGQLRKPVPYQVIYPNYSRTAPIPQPVIFISKSAKLEDLEKLLNDHAPQVYAYNALFNTKMLPQYEEIERALKKHPEFLDEVRKAKGNVSAENTREAIYQAYLRVTYGMLAVGLAPVALVAMIASPFLAPILITQVVIVVL